MHYCLREPGVGLSALDHWLDGGGFLPFERAYEPGTVLTLQAEPDHLGKSFRGWRIGSKSRGKLVRDLSLDVTVPVGTLEIEAVYEDGIRHATR